MPLRLFRTIFPTRVRWAALVTYWAAMTAGTHWPQGVQIASNVDDKSMHYGAYFGLAILCCSVTGRKGLDGWSILKRYGTVVLLLGIYAGLDALTQTFSPGRVPDLADFVADMMGVVTAVVVYWRIESRLPVLDEPSHPTANSH